MKLTHYGLETPNGNTDLGQYWPMQWLVAWQHQVITWTNADFSLVRICGIHMRAIPQQVTKLSLCMMSLEIMILRLLPYLPGDYKFEMMNFSASVGDNVPSRQGYR